MPRTGTVKLLHRLDLLASRLTSDAGRLTIDTLAEELDVSRRTLCRDLALLRERGLPVEADRGRGGGVRLERHWAVGRLALSYREAVDLLVSLAIARQLGSAVLLSNLEPIRHKLSATLSRDLKRRVEGLTRRILVGRTASPLVLGAARAAETSVVERLNQAFVQQNVLAIRYEDACGSRTNRHVEPHFLLLNYPVWYVLAWDRLREATRTFRCDRIVRAQLLEHTFALRPLAEFSESTLGADVVFP